MSHRLAWLALVLFALPVACGGKATPLEETTGDTGTADTSSSGETSGSEVSVEDAPAIDAPKPKPTADTCKKFLEATCSSKTESCCTTAGLGWTAGACTTNLDYYCQSLVDAVTLGRATYDPASEDACLKGWQESLTVCMLDGLSSARYQVPCAHWFNGVKKPGDACTGKTFVECEAPEGFAAYCDVKPGETSGRCRVYGFVGLDKPCNFLGTTVRYCDKGLYCDMTSPSAVCKTAKPLGATCEGADDYSCGDNYCKDRKCTARLAEGSTCTAWSECQSYECGTDGKCTKLTPAVSSWMCTGM